MGWYTTLLVGDTLNGVVDYRSSGWYLKLWGGTLYASGWYLMYLGGTLCSDGWYVEWYLIYFAFKVSIEYPGHHW